MVNTITMDIEQILLDFYNSDTLDEILDNSLEIMVSEPVYEDYIDKRNEMVTKHIRKWLEGYKINKGGK